MVSAPPGRLTDRTKCKALLVTSGRVCLCPSPRREWLAQEANSSYTVFRETGDVIPTVVGLAQFASPGIAT